MGGHTFKTLGCVGLMLGVGSCAVLTGKARYQETTIKRLVEKGKGGDQKYLVFTEDGVFENTDQWFFLKFASSDLQSEMLGKEGDRVRLKVRGWRIPILSNYENIYGVEVLKDASGYGGNLDGQSRGMSGELSSLLTNPHKVPFNGPLVMTPNLVQRIADYQKNNMDIGIFTAVRNGVLTDVFAYDANKNVDSKQYVGEISELLR